MNWTELTIYTSKLGIEPVTGSLLKLGVNGFVVEDPDDIRSFIDENSGLWDLVDEDVTAMCDVEPNIKIYISDTPQGYELVKQVYMALEELKLLDENKEYGRLEAVINTLKDEDWENNWKVYFKPFPVGKKLAVKPTWEDYDNPQGRIVLEIDPGNSFGSGLHETTKLCLTAVEERVTPEMSVVDVGCGSGILSVAAAKLGAKKVTGIDIDENAVLTAKACAETNGVSAQVTILQGDLTQQLNGQADLVVGNLFANIIRRLTPDVRRILKDGGCYLTSGIITDTLEEVLNAYRENGFEILRTENIGEWYLVEGRKL